MPLNLPSGFSNDIKGKDTNLVPVVVIGDLNTEWEKQNGDIPKKSWVLIKTGWSSRFNDPEAYANFNTNDQMPNTPGISKEASELLANEKDVLGVGVETVGTDAGIAPSFDPQFPNHNIMHGAGKMGLTSLCNLDLIPI